MKCLLVLSLVCVLLVPAMLIAAQPPTPTPGPTPTPIPAGAKNADWTPVEREIGGVPMVWVPPGCFMMGSETGRIDEKPVHEVCLTEGFWMDKYEVTNAAYQRFIDEGGYGRREYWSDEGWNWKGLRTAPEDCGSDFNGPQQPVVCVTWYEAEAYASWRGGRLPAEAEWEYAARGPQSLVYPWGNSWDATKANTYENGAGRTQPVGSHEDGKSWVGAYDLIGNVWEWVQDWYDESYYAISPRENPPGPGSGSMRTARGGSWGYQQDSARAALRLGPHPAARDGFLGFRVVVSVPVS